MLGLQLVTAVFGALTIILAINNRTLRTSIQEGRDVSQRSLMQAERQLTGCKQLMDTTSEKAKKLDQSMHDEMKKVALGASELARAKEELAQSKKKIEEQAGLQQSIDDALARETDLKTQLADKDKKIEELAGLQQSINDTLARETDLKTQLADKDKKIEELAGLQKSLDEALARETDLKTQLSTTQNDVKAKVDEIAKLKEQGKKAEPEKKAEEKKAEEKKA